MAASMDSSGAYVLDEVSPYDVAKNIIESGRQKEPFYVFDMDEAYRRITYFKKNMPRVQVCYAMKSNSHNKILKLAVAMGLGFDCASPGEIHKVLQLNVSPLSIIFANPTKPPEWMTYARKSGVRHTTVDSSCELLKIKKYWSDAKLLLRVKVDSDSIYKLGDKFGCDFETEAIGLLEEAAALNLQVVGVAFHVGSGCLSIESHLIGLQRARALFDHEERAGRRMYIVDIGGGFLSDSIDVIDEVSQLTNKTLEELFPDPSVQVIAEPGRYICDSAFTLYCNITNIRQTVKENEQVNMVFIRDGVYGTLRFNEPWHTVKMFELSNGKDYEKTLEKKILWGPSCNSIDRVMENSEVLLPKCSLSDWLVFPLRGGYTIAASSCFSCLQIPAIRNVVSKALWNDIKHHPVFKCEDFVEDPDLPAPLPSKLPPIVSEINHYDHGVILKLD